MLNGGGGLPGSNKAEAWLEQTQKYQHEALTTRLRIPILFGVDAIHGHGHVDGATIFPQAIGLGATRDADLVRQVGAITAEEMLATGIHWNFSPVVAVPQDIRWGRTYESFGEDTALVSELASAFIQGQQGSAGSVPAGRGAIHLRHGNSQAFPGRWRDNLRDLHPDAG